MLLSPTSRLRRLPAATLAVLALLLGSLVAVASPAQAVPGTGSPVFINEIHYDNAGTDAGEAVEVAAPAGTDLSGWSIVRYNGNTPGAAATYTSPAASNGLGLVNDSGNGWGFSVVNYPANGLQNGPNDGLALVNGSTVVQLLSYAGVLTASNGPAAGMTSTDIGVTESGTTPAGFSLQLTGGPGDDPADFTWTAAAAGTFGAANTGQTFVSEGDSAPAVSSTTPANGADDVAVDSNLTVTFSEPVDLSGEPFGLTCASSGTHATSVSGGPSTFTLDPGTDFAQNENCSATVTAANVTDQDTDDPPNAMATDYSWSFTTVAPAPSCDNPESHTISQVQGPGAASPFVNSVVTVQAVVTAIRPGLSGFFIQEETADIDGLDTTSEGIFVRTTPPASVLVGDVVQVTGGVREFAGSGSSQTQISDQVTVLDCGIDVVPPAGVLELPMTDVSDFEHFEGMRVTMPQALVISEYFNYARFNEVVVGLPPNGRSRFDTPTAVQEPNTATTTATLADYARRRITIDDGRGTQNTSPPVFPGMVDTPFTLDNTFRGGDTLTDVTGVMEHTFGLYRVHPTEDADYTSVNPRPAAPPEVGGNVKVASFNVLNYFLTLNDGGPNTCGAATNQECRGANDEGERLRQRAKIVDAIASLDADVVGLMEMENTPGVNPAADLVDGLNAATAPGTYSYIDTGVIGTDAIRLGFLYQPATVSPVGSFEVLDSSDDPRFDDTRSRPALAQTFQRVGTPDRVTVAVNHLKSKGSACTGDPDTGDGAGNCNVTRTNAAMALADWLASDPTGSGDPDSLIIGDLNSYDHENPIDALVAAGYTDLVKKFGGEYAYGYVFDGQIGYLDHGLANASLLPQVTGAAEWHINADEPTILDYDTTFKGPNEDAMYEPNGFRSSDHDPVLLGLDMGGCSFTDDAATKVRTLDGDCFTDSTVGVPDGWTLDGAGHSITAYDLEGEHFRGAVVANEGTVANVRNLTVTAYELADVCDADADRLRGILLEGASGSITGNTVVGIKQATNSGCQEGNGIEARNEPFTSGKGPKGSQDQVVTISGNTVRDYQKAGIVANGAVRALISDNTVQGAGPVGHIAQNGVQIGFGGTGDVTGNRISDNFYTGPDDACGVLFFDDDKAKERANVFSGNEVDVCKAKSPKEPKPPKPPKPPKEPKPAKL